MLLYSIMPWMQCTAQIQNFLVVPKRQKRDTYRNEQNSNHNKRSIPKQLARAIPWFTVLSYECLSLFFLKLVTSSLLFEIRHVGGRDGLSIEFQSTQGTDLSPVVVFHKEGDALDALIFHVLQQYIVGVFFQILAGHFDRSGRIDVLNVFESEVVAIDKEQDASGVLFGIRPVVEFRHFDRVDLYEFTKFKVQNKLFVCVGLAAEAGVPNHEVGPGKPGVLVAGIAAGLFELVGEIDGFWKGADHSRGGGAGSSNRSHGDVFGGLY
mmetsp:Transcript_287/g.612  ORF Transcript_287/g.612 Transcript_287/m.612 type:complete len:266 (+) Transcript_287:281-1078(+)